MKSKRQNSSSYNERGQSLVELALTLVLLLTLLAGIVNLGIAFFSWVTIRDAAQEGAQFGSIYPLDENGNLNTAQIENRTRDASPGSIVDLWRTDLVTVTVTVIGDTCAGGGMNVTIVYNVPITMPFVDAFAGQDFIPVRATVTDTILIPPCP
jgi:Flp pilus assembly protein TadG